MFSSVQKADRKVGIMKAVILKTNGDNAVVEFSNETAYAVLSGAVGGLIQMVELPAHDVTLWVNEEGKLDGLPVNAKATALWVENYGHTDIIVGDVIITGGADDEGYTLGLSDEDAIRLLQM